MEYYLRLLCSFLSFGSLWALKRKIGINYLTVYYISDFLKRMDITHSKRREKSERYVIVNSIEELEKKLDILY